jgi:hypothetical protein
MLRALFDKGFRRLRPVVGDDHEEIKAEVSDKLPNGREPPVLSVAHEREDRYGTG